MSAWIVSENTLIQIAQHLHKEAGGALEDTEALQELTNKLNAMNYAAVNVCYNEHTEPNPIQYRVVVPASDVALFKLMDCYLYQCSEGCVPATWPLFAEVEKARVKLAHHICRSLPEYDAAPWCPSMMMLLERRSDN